MIYRRCDDNYRRFVMKYSPVLPAGRFFRGGFVFSGGSAAGIRRLRSRANFVKSHVFLRLHYGVFNSLG